MHYISTGHFSHLWFNLSVIQTKEFLRSTVLLSMDNRIFPLLIQSEKNYQIIGPMIACPCARLLWRPPRNEKSTKLLVSRDKSCLRAEETEKKPWGPIRIWARTHTQRADYTSPSLTKSKIDSVERRRGKGIGGWRIAMKGKGAWEPGKQSAFSWKPTPWGPRALFSGKTASHSCHL